MLLKETLEDVHSTKEKTRDNVASFVVIGAVSGMGNCVHQKLVFKGIHTDLGRTPLKDLSSWSGVSSLESLRSEFLKTFAVLVPVQEDRELGLHRPALLLGFSSRVLHPGQVDSGNWAESGGAPGVPVSRALAEQIASSPLISVYDRGKYILDSTWIPFEFFCSAFWKLKLQNVLFFLPGLSFSYLLFPWKPWGPKSAE